MYAPTGIFTQGSGHSAIFFCNDCRVAFSYIRKEACRLRVALSWFTSASPRTQICEFCLLARLLRPLRCCHSCGSAACVTCRCPPPRGSPGDTLGRIAMRVRGFLVLKAGT